MHICLINYLHLFVDFTYTGFNENISLRTVNSLFMILTWCHLILSLSSLQFLVPRTRTGIQPMIWQEFGLHSICFASRSLINANLEYFLGSTTICNLSFCFKELSGARALVCALSKGNAAAAEDISTEGKTRADNTHNTKH